MKNKRDSLLTITGIIILAFIIAKPFYILYEGRQAIITQFGKPVGGAVKEAGLHFKIPFIQKVNVFEKRILEWDGYPSEIPTKDKKYIWVDTTARWRIDNPLKFFQSVYDERGAHARLDDIVDAAVRDAITSHNLIEIVRSSNDMIQELKEVGEPQEWDSMGEEALENIKYGRDMIRQEIIERAREITPQYGIELIDVRLKRVSYVEEVREKVYERMVAERNRAAEKYRSEGRGQRAEIEGKMEKELKRITSEAYRDAQEIRGQAQAEATSIYAGALGRDPEFYSFLKTLETYSRAVDQNTVVILTTDSEYLKYLKNYQSDN